MLHRKQYRVAVRVTIMVLALTLTACGTQENTGSTESVKSTEAMENAETVKSTETVESTETIENAEIIEAMVAESAAPQGTANVTPEMQPTCSRSPWIPHGNMRIILRSIPEQRCCTRHRRNPDAKVSSSVSMPDTGRRAARR